MGSRTASGIPSKSVQFGCLNSVFLLILVISACICRPSAGESHGRSKHHNYFVYQVKKDEWKNQQEPTGKCLLSIAGSKRLEQGVQLPLAHTYGSCSPIRGANLSWESVLPRILERDLIRAQALLPRILGNISDSAESMKIPINSGTKMNVAGYVTRLGFGTPKEDYVVEVDTASDITWILCKPCPSCSSERGAVFDPQRSSSFKPLQCISDGCKDLRNATVLDRSCLIGDYCVYSIRYMDNTLATGQFCLEKLTVASDTFDDFGFGCVHNTNGHLPGILGLGRSTIAFPYQTIEKYGGIFSYCLPDYNSNALGSLSFGQSAVPSSGVFTEMLMNRSLSNFYYLALSGISVGGQLVAVPSRLFKANQGGARTFIDSGTAVTSFAGPIYDAFRASFLNQTSTIRRAADYSVFDTCYSVPLFGRASFPDVTLHFKDGAEVNLNGRRVMIPVNAWKSHVCLAFGRSRFNFNLIGSFQQGGFRVSYDISSQRIGFAPESCNSD